MIVYGPFEIPFEANTKASGVKRITSEHAKAFWRSADVGGLRQKRGCYVFALRAAKGFKPWYVGKAARGFQQEVFTSHKQTHYNKALFRGDKGSPVLFFVAPPGTKRAVPNAELNDMEKNLIQYAFERNPDLCNVQNTKSLPQWTIKGVIRSPRGKPSKNAKSFKKMMQI